MAYCGQVSLVFCTVGIISLRKLLVVSIYNCWIFNLVNFLVYLVQNIVRGVIVRLFLFMLSLTRWPWQISRRFRGLLSPNIFSTGPFFWVPVWFLYDAWIESLWFYLLLIQLSCCRLVLLYCWQRSECLGIILLLIEIIFKEALVHLSLVNLVHQATDLTLNVPHFLHSLVRNLTLEWQIWLDRLKFFTATGQAIFVACNLTYRGWSVHILVQPINVHFSWLVLLRKQLSLWLRLVVFVGFLLDLTQYTTFISEFIIALIILGEAEHQRLWVPDRRVNIPISRSHCFRISYWVCPWLSVVISAKSRVLSLSSAGLTICIYVLMLL